MLRLFFIVISFSYFVLYTECRPIDGNSQYDGVGHYFGGVGSAQFDKYTTNGSSEGFYQKN